MKTEVIHDSEAKSNSTPWKRSFNNISSNSLNNNFCQKDNSPEPPQNSANNSTLSLHIAAYEDLFEVGDSSAGNEEQIKKSKNANTVWSFQQFKDSKFITNPFEFPRQQENAKDNHPEVMQFKASQRLLNPNETEPTTTDEPGDVPKRTSNGKEYEDEYYESSDSNSGLDVPSDDEDKKSNVSENSGTSSGLEVPSEDDEQNDTKIKREPKKVFNEEERFEFVNKLENAAKSIRNSSAFEILRQYELFLKKVPDSIKPTSVGDTVTAACCAEMCALKFSPDFVMRARLRIPTSNIEKIHFFQFMIIQSCTTYGGRFFPKINETPICEEFFRRLYVIPKGRFDSFVEQLALGFAEPLPHGNKGKSIEHSSTSLRAAKLLTRVDPIAQPHPSDHSYFLPAGSTKTEIIKRVDFNTSLKINPTQEFGRLHRTFRFHKANSFTKCKTCVHLKVAMKNVQLSLEDRNEAEIHLKNHWKNIENDRRDAFMRELASLHETHYLLALGHDGMSKELSKFPNPTTLNTKLLTDTMKMMCSLNLSLAHRQTGDTPYQLHCFWNIDQMSGAKASTVITQCFYTLSYCNPIPPYISIQLDNCASNKCYTTLGAFGLLLLWIPKLTAIYICTSEVGHTHNEIDQKFGVFAKALKGYARFAEKTFKGLKTNNLLPTTYDFEELVRKNVVENGQLAKNHFFELTRQPDNTVTVKIARFLRSENYLPSNDSAGFKLFKEPPNADEFPKIIEPNKFDIEKHTKLCKALSNSMSPENFEELSNLPQYITENYNPEPFEVLLKRISDNVVAPNINVIVPEDPENAHVEAFLNRIKKVWDPLTSEAADTSISTNSNAETPKKRPSKRKTTDTPSSSGTEPKKQRRNKKFN
uniref:Uncharacterized protein n=1 Tax=Panagrolaimus sp. ES5 TaxID=591445 RepID=A0AC34FS86_9BILA